MSDPINLSLVQRILGYGVTNTVAYMMRGLNYDDLAKTNGDRERPVFKLWEALTDGNVYPRKVSRCRVVVSFGGRGWGGVGEEGAFSVSTY